MCDIVKEHPVKISLKQIIIKITGFLPTFSVLLKINYKDMVPLNLLFKMVKMRIVFVDTYWTCMLKALYSLLM